MRRPFYPQPHLTQPNPTPTTPTPCACAPPDPPHPGPLAAGEWLQGEYDTKQQAELCNKIAVDLGFSLDNGRLDVSVHPFTGGEAPMPGALPGLAWPACSCSRCLCPC